jgi:AraC-like DNA-binding protein
MPGQHLDSSPSIRAASIEGFADLVRRLDGDPAALLQSVGLDMRALVEPDMRISGTQLLRLLELAAVETGAEDFGLRLAQMHGLANLGPIGILAREERSVGEALQTLIDYLYLHNSVTHLRVDATSEPALLAVFVQADTPAPSRQATDLALGATTGVLRSFLGAHWNPRAVQFAYGAPARDATHRRVFRCRLEFDAPLNALQIATRDLRAPLQSSSHAFQRQARQWIESLAVRARSESAFADDVRRLIVMLLSSGRCSADRLATFYGVDRRTLHRRLAQSDHSFNSLVSEVRRDLADRRVSESRLSLGEISHALGFDQQSSFSRWFRKEFGVSAAEWRRGVRGGSDTQPGAASL